MMSLTESDWKARMAEKANKLAPVRQVNESYLRQAAVSSELLTSHPAWDVYLQRLQVDLNDAKDALLSWQEKVAGALTDADLRKVQIEINVFQDRVKVLIHCMSLPKEIIAHAHDALDNSVQ